MKHYPLRTIIIDDEKAGRDTLVELLQMFPDVEVLAQEADSIKGLEAICQYKPDVVFLDIQMPGKSGIELAHELQEKEIDIALVFVTGYNEYAIQAIKLAAFDYIIKPIDPEELSAVIRKLKDKKANKEDYSNLESLLAKFNNHQRIRINTRTGFVVIDPEEIVYLEAAGNYTKIIFSSSKKETTSQNLGALMALLPEKKFLRISRSCLINLSYLFRLERKIKKCTLEKNGELFTLSISRNQICQFDEILPG